jgi:hypothetical protein
MATRTETVTSAMPIPNFVSRAEEVSGALTAGSFP